MAGGDIKLPDLVSQAKIDTKGVDAGLNRVEKQLKGVGGVADATGGRFANLNKVGTSAIDGLSTSLTSGLGPASGLAKDKIDSVGASALASGGLLKTALAGGAIAAGLALTAFAVGGISKATDLAESQSKVSVVFKESAGEIERFASGSARNLGLTKQATLEAAGTFGNLFSSIGIGLPKTTEMSIGLVKLAADLASFNNIDPTVALEKLRSGIVGEIEPLRSLGVSFNAADVERKAFELGLVSAGGKADDSAKAQARYALILEKTALAQGDFARTSDGLANQQRILTAQVNDLQAEFGKALIPVLNQVAQVAIPVISGINGITEKVGGLGAILGNVARGAAPFLGLLDLLPGKHKSAGDAADAQKGADAALGTQMDATGEQTKGLTDNLEAQAKALDKVTNATLSTISSQLSYEASVNTLKDNIADLDDKTEAYSEAVAKNGANSKEAESANRALRDAHLGIEQSAVAAANAAVRLADDQATAAGQSLNAQQKANIFRDALVNLANQATGPTRDALLALADQVLGLPNRTVSVDADTSSALAKISYLERRLSAISAAAVGADVANAPGRHAGGPVKAGMPYVVGEFRPELFVPEVSGYIVPRVPTSSPGAPGAAGVVQNFHVYPSAGMDERDLATLVAREEAWAAGR